ncbi:MAG: sulfatase-like hydrolase/transferase [Candidatus Aminicenantes bacterium]|nr:MAG: sulfatase-like hydrolase/transferase [Candidatus Aminicenantes bacterium]
MDHNIGRLLHKLEEMALEKITLVVFTSDNGGIWKRTSQRSGFPNPARFGRSNRRMEAP